MSYSHPDGDTIPLHPSSAQSDMDEIESLIHAAPSPPTVLPARPPSPPRASIPISNSPPLPPPASSKPQQLPPFSSAAASSSASTSVSIHITADGFAPPPNTLTEPVWDTVKRDLSRIVSNLKLVVFPNPFREDPGKALRDWDLWGPFFFIVFLGLTLSWSASVKKMHTKKRNRLLHKRLNDLVFVAYNRKMKTRFQKRREKAGKNYDPLVIEDFDWDNEWTDSLVVPPQGGRECDLTWDDVDEAIGASRSLRGRNLPRQANRFALGEPVAFQRRPRSTTMVVEEDGLDEQGQDSDSGNDEDEEEDPHDDADVSDCDEAPNATEDGGENLDSTNNPNEFDDGY